MSDIQQLARALRAAHNAGDVEGARRLAAAIERQQAMAAQPQRQRTPEEEEAELQRLVPGVSIDPTDGMSGLDRFRAGFGKSFVDTGRGIGQLVGLVDQASIDEAAKLDAPLNATGAGLAGNITGGITQVVAPGAGLVGLGTKAPRLAQAGRVLLNPRAAVTATGVRGGLQTAAVAGGVGAGLAALQPVTSDETRVGNMAQGAVFGAAGQGVGEVIGAAARPVIRALGRGRQAQATAGDIIRGSAADPAAVARLQTGQVSGEYVRGSLPTTAEAVRDPGLAALERTLRAGPGSGQFVLRDQQRNAARVQAIEEAFGGASNEAADAIRARVAQAQAPAIREARRVTGVESQRVITAIDRVANSARFRNAPPVQQALATARGLIAEPLDDAQRISAARAVANDAMASPGRMSAADFDAVREAARIVRGANLRGETADQALQQLRALRAGGMNARMHIANMQRTLAAVERGRPDVASLYNARKYITQTLMRRADDETMVALRGVVARLDEQIGEAAPTFRPYLRDYAAGMREADQAAVGARILQTGGRATPDSPSARVALGPASFINATRNLDQLTQAATGFSRATADRTLTAAQRQTIDAVRRDLDRYAYMQTSRASVGSPTAELGEGQNQLGRQVAGLAADALAPGASVPLALIDTAIAQVGARQGARVQAIVREAMLDPQRAEEVLATLPVDVRQDVIRTIGPTLGQLRLGAVAGYTGAANARADDRQDPLELEVRGLPENRESAIRASGGR